MQWRQTIAHMRKHKLKIGYGSNFRENAGYIFRSNTEMEENTQKQPYSSTVEICPDNPS